MLRPLYFKKDTGTVLVRLKESGAIETPDKQHKTFSRGEVLSMDVDNIAYEHDDDRKRMKNLLNREVYFEEYMDSCQVDEDDEKYAFIELHNIKGFKDEK